MGEETKKIEQPEQETLAELAEQDLDKVAGATRVLVQEIVIRMRQV